MRDVHQAFGVPDEEVSAGGELVGEAADDLGLGGGIEVDEDVPAEDEVLVWGNGIVSLEEVNPFEGDA
jgi:hypothetical protein